MPWEAKERVVLAAFVAALVVLVPVIAADDDGAPGQAPIESALLNASFLEEEGYLDEEGMVPVIIQLDDTIPIATGEDIIGNTLQDDGYVFEPGLHLSFTNSLAARIPHDALDVLSSVLVVEKVWLDWQGELALQDSVPLINATKAWEHSASTEEGSLNDQPLTGAGVNVSIIDSGLAYDHVEFGGCEKPINYSQCERIVTGWDYVDDDADPYDETDHGTHVAGIAGAGGVNLHGVAPESKFLVYRVSDAGQIEGSDASAKLSVVSDAVENSTNNGASIISMSLIIYCQHPCHHGEDLLSQTVDHAVQERGVVVVAAMANDGPDNDLMGSPASAKGSITVGATYKKNYTGTEPAGLTRTFNCEDEAPRVDQIACFSSRGPTGDGRTKPDVVAPGVHINSTREPGRQSGDCSSTESWEFCYRELSGTSMSTPHVTGTIALMLQADPTQTPTQVKDKLRSSTIVPPDMTQYLDGERGPDEAEYAYGWGRIDAYRALDQAPPTTTLTLTGDEGNHDWHTSTVQATFTTTDAPDVLDIHTGPRELYWSHDGDPAGETVTLNGVAPNQTLTGEQTIAEDGVHTLTAYGVDNGGNTEASKTWTVKIDQTPPTTDRMLQADGNGTLVTLTPNDATSDIDTTRYQVNDDAWQPYEDAFLAQPGDEVRYHSTDNAGNEEAITVFDVPDVSFEEPKDGHVTLTAGDTRIEEPLPAPLQTTHNPGAITIGTVEFEIHVGTQHSNVTHADVTITDSTGQHIDTVELTYNHTTPEDKHAWAGTWTPPPDQALEHLTAKAGVTNADGAHAATSTTLTTVGHSQDTANTSLFLPPPLEA